MNTRSCLGTLSLAGLVAFLAGCPNPQIYGTPRTLDPGKWQVMAAAEGFGVAVNVPQYDSQGRQVGTTSDSIFLPNLPSVGARVGLADRVDLGFGLRNLYAPTLDLKVNFLKTKYFDMGVDPMINYFIATGGGSTLQLFYFHLPLLMGINVSENVSFVLTPGFVYGLLVGTYASSSSASTTDSAFFSSAPWFRGGLGLNIRVNRKIALQPEFTVMKAFNDASATLYNFGIGVSFLNQPDYSEDWTGAKATDD